MDPIRFDHLPVPLGVKKGRWAHVRGNPSVQWVTDKFDWRALAERTKTVIAIVTGIIAIAIAAKSLF